MTTTFDPTAFKATTRAQWETAADAWHRWGPSIEDWLGEATERMLDDVRLTPGARVLDVAAGAGGQSFAAARRVGPSGHVLATDISPAILEHAAAVAADQGLTQVATLEADGEDLSAVPDGSFDAAISRVGLIYFPDQHGALSEVHRVLRPGGRFSSIVYSTPDLNGFFALPVGIIRRIAGLPAPAPGLPGPFSLAAPGVAEAA
ncbi:SAM-dependent methyltransferase [Nocardioides sp. BE266]|uniref:class I SAM-dependent methyltransferase n=1 Tax=Nocardioides sp. BE266 TaxID=2817725 RepID=UPI00285892EF|nr:methyltransferase domain-containing protein [Nocardioides sp. BE266]MDR7251318.1 SAM-dependent methyltransferase [Nocardioides sp. BE266]